MAFVTGDAEKARLVGEKYGVTDTYSYERFDELLASGKIDAIYLATRTGVTPSSPSRP